MSGTVVLSDALPRLLDKVEAIKIYREETTYVYWAEVYHLDGKFSATWATTLEELFCILDTALSPKPLLDEKEAL